MPQALDINSLLQGRLPQLPKPGGGGGQPGQSPMPMPAPGGGFPQLPGQAGGQAPPSSYGQPIGKNPFGIPLQDLNALGTTIPPEVQALTDQLMSRGQTEIGRMLEQYGMNFGGGDILSTARDRGTAMLGGELGSGLLSNVLGIQASSAEAQRGRAFGERQNLINSAIQKMMLGEQLTSQEKIAMAQISSNQSMNTQNAQLQKFLQEAGFQHQFDMSELSAQQMPLQMLAMALGIPGFNIGQGSNSGGGGFGFNLGVPISPIGG